MELSSFSVEALTRRRPLTPISSHHDVLGSETKPSSPDLQQQSSGEHKLKRNLGLADIIFYGVGCSVGAGIYSLVGIGASLAGPSIAVSFLICGIACIFTSLSYAEFAARVPLAGSAYTFTYVSFGELCGWLVGWNLTLGYAVSAAVVARSWAEYVTGFLSGLPGFANYPNYRHFLMYMTKLPLPLPLPLQGSNDVYTCSPLSMLIIGLCTLILVTGVKESARFNTAITILNLSVLGFVLLSGIFSGTICADNFLPVFPHGITGMARGAGLVFFSYLGFDMVACLSEECKNPARNLPIGIIGSLLVSMSIYVSVSLVVIGIAPIALLGDDTPIVNALLANSCCTHEEQIQGGDIGIAIETCLDYSSCQRSMLRPVLFFGSRLVSFGAIFGLTTATFACLMGQPRINFAAAQDGLLFKAFAKVHPRTGVPTIGTIITGFLTTVVACFFDLEFLANAISLGTLQVFTFVNAGVILLRTRPHTTTSSVDASPSSSNHTGIGDESNDGAGKNVDEMSPLLPKAPLVQDPEAAAAVRALGLITQSSREIRDLVRRTERMSSRLLPQTTSQTAHNNGSRPVLLVLLFTIACVVASVTFSSSFKNRYLVIVCMTCILVVSAGYLFALPQSPKPQTFSCPLVPAVPLMGIVCNSYMMGSMPRMTWLVIIGWLFVGLVFYFGYGIHHSELKIRAQREPATM